MYLPDSPESRAELAQYYQSVTRVDRGVERLIDILKENNKYDNTLIIYISDNGMAFPGAKTTIYEHGIQLPCIVRLPKGENSGDVRDGFISSVDLTPTILDITETSYNKEDISGHQATPDPWLVCKLDLHGRHSGCVTYEFLKSTPVEASLSRAGVLRYSFPSTLIASAVSWSVMINSIFGFSQISRSS